MAGSAERHEQVFSHTHLREKSQLLRNIGNVFIKSRIGRRVVTIDQHLTARSAIGSGQNFNECRFTGTVFASKNMRATQLNFQVNAVQRGYARKVPA